MKLATFENARGEQRIALVHGAENRLFDLAAATERAGRANATFRSMIALADAGKRGLDAAADRRNSRRFTGGLRVGGVTASVYAAGPGAAIGRSRRRVEVEPPGFGHAFGPPVG